MRFFSTSPIVQKHPPGFEKVRSFGFTFAFRDSISTTFALSNHRTETPIVPQCPEPRRRLPDQPPECARDGFRPVHSLQHHIHDRASLQSTVSMAEEPTYQDRSLVRLKSAMLRPPSKPIRRNSLSRVANFHPKSNCLVSASPPIPR